MDRHDNKQVIKMLFTLGLPIILQSILQTMLPIIDQIMVGQLGEDVIAAIGVSGRLFNIFYFIVMALAGTTSIYVAQYWGSKDVKAIPKILRIPTLTGLLCLAVLIFIAFVFPEDSVKLFTNDNKIAAMAAEYQKIYVISAIPVLFTNIYSAMLRSTLRVKIPMVSGIMSVFINTGLNFVLIFGFGPIPAMGAWGAVLATLIARCIEFLVLAFYIHVLDKDVHVTPISLFYGKLDKTFRKKFIASMLPLVLNNLCYVFAETVYNIFYGQMSKTDVAAQSIMQPVQSFSVGLFSGMAAATAIILGHKLGKGEINSALKSSKIILRFILISTLITSVVIALFSSFYLKFYKIDDELLQTSQLLLYASCVFLTVKVMNMVICQGVLECGGDTKFILINNIIGPICIGIPLAMLSFFVLHLPIYGMFSLVTMEEVVRLVIGYIKYRKSDWARNITEKNNNSLEVN